MKVDEEGNVVIALEDIIQNMSKEEKKRLCKIISIDYDVKKSVIDYICDEDEDGWWSSDNGEYREEILIRVERCHLENPNGQNWKLIGEAIERLKHARSQQHIYWTLYHLENKDMRVSDFIRLYMRDEDQFMTKKAETDIEEIMNIVKEALNR